AMITDSSGNIEYVNRSFERSSGYSLDEVRGKNPRIFRSGQQPPQLYADLWQTISRGETWRGILCNRTKAGESRWECITIHPIPAREGTTARFLAIKEDVSAQRQVEDELRQAQKFEALGVLAGGVAHDYNNILTAILAHVALLKRNATLPPEAKDSVLAVEELSRRAAALTRQLVDFSRPQASLVEPIDAAALVAQLAHLLRRLVPDNISFVAHPPRGTLFMLANAGMIEQVLTNLIINARDAINGAGRISVEVSGTEIAPGEYHRHPDAYPGRFICFRITDTGIGMDRSTQARLFEPFFTTKLGTGNGLGLATSLMLIRQQHGWIDVTSEPGRGTTFRVYLPEAETRTKSAPRLAAAAPGGGTELILIVEDDRDVRTVIGVGFRQLGYTVFEASNGREALDIYRNPELRIAGIVTDHLMPGGINGVELVRLMRQVHSQAVAIICSGYDRDRLGHSGHIPANTTFVPKPVDVLALGGVLRRLLNAVAADRARADLKPVRSDLAARFR
ncbi:MAG TPA: ATP-binding protein, partial [Opitutaceae bacterium]|nr:ATP-binding protein [Opitutaceae bacterium]